MSDAKYQRFPNFTKSCGMHIEPLKDIRDAVIADNVRTKIKTYKEINPELSVNEVYRDTNIYVRIEFTRFRTSSHNLQVEKGRWQRIPRQQRYCSCENASVQDETHVIFNCQYTTDLRVKFNISQVTPMSEIFNIKNIYFIYEIMKIFN